MNSNSNKYKKEKTGNKFSLFFHPQFQNLTWHIQVFEMLSKNSPMSCYVVHFVVNTNKVFKSVGSMHSYFSRSEQFYLLEAFTGDG